MGRGSDPLSIFILRHLGAPIDRLNFGQLAYHYPTLRASRSRLSLIVLFVVFDVLVIYNPAGFSESAVIIVLIYNSGTARCFSDLLYLFLLGAIF